MGLVLCMSSNININYKFIASTSALIVHTTTTSIQPSLRKGK